MTNINVKVTHLFHSGFMVETVNNLMVFDYCDPRPHFDVDEKAILTHKDFKNKENVFVFSSHSHRDHFDKKILDWNVYNNIQYVFSDDISLESTSQHHYFMKPYEHKALSNLTIMTYGSTDLGLSFLVKVDGVTIFHAGDLNWWHWKKDSQKVQKKEEKDFKANVDRLKGTDIDIAFIPVDPRLEEYYYLAGEYFTKTINPKVIIPMHFENHYSICKDFHDKISDFKASAPILTKQDRSFIYKK